MEDAEELADFMNDLWQQSQDIEDLFCNAILTLLEKYFRLKYTTEGIMLGLAFDNKINVLEELLREVGKEHLMVDFYERITEEAT